MKFIFLAMLSILVSCSQESSKVDINRIAERNNDENIIILAELNVTNSATGIIGLSDQQLGSLEQGVTIVQDLFIKNTTPSAVNFNASANDANVTLDKTFCTAAATRGTCKFVATIKASQTLGQQISSITINGQTLNYVLNVIPKVVPLPALSYPNPMDVGITQSAPISKSFTVINQSMNTLAYVIDSSQTNSQFSITSNCPSVDRNRGCPVSITFTPTQPLVAGMVTSNFKLNGVTINIQATVDAPTTLPPVTPPVNPWDFGDIEQGKAKTISISITNRTGISDTGPLSVTGLTNFSNPIITCPTSWDRNRTCKITLTFNATGKNVQEYLETLTLKGSKIQLDLNLRANVIFPSGIVPCTLANSPSYGVNINNVSTVSGNIPLCQVSTCTDSNLYEVSPDQLSCIDKAIPCQLTDVQTNGWNTANQLTISGMKIGSDVSQCVVQSCITNYSVNSNLKSCEADACTMLNASSFGVNLLNVESVSGITPNCIVSTCSNPSLFEVSPDQKSCVDKPLACTLADAQSNGWNITNAQTPTGTKVGTNLTQCAVSVCNPNFSLNLTNKTCDAIACTLVNASGNGVTSILNVSTVSGTLPNCSVTSCSANYKPAADSKSCIAKLCNELNASELSTLGFNTTNATISGTYPSCTLSCNSSLQQLAGDGKSCVDKTPTGSISFVQDYTKNLSGNLLNITQTNAQQIQFYSDASCSIPLGLPLSMPLTQTSITVSSGDGTKNAYAKLINGSASSSCLTDSIMLDQTAPVLAITNPLNNANIAGNSLIVSGTCSEVNSSTVQIGITINGVTQNVNCSSGNFSSSAFNITSLAAGPYTISVSATDLATNIGTASIAFNRIICTSLQTISGNTCIDNTPTGSISFVQNYTKNLTGNLLNITQSNAQQIQFYSDATCSTIAGTALSMPLTQTSITVSSGDGTKNAYAKLINGSASSTCLTDSIILDTVSPVLAVTTPTAGQTITTSSVSISGTCSDALSGVANPISITIDGVTGTTTTNCSTGSFTSSINVSSLTYGTTYTLRFSITDNAGNNVNNITRTFVRSGLCVPNSTQSCTITNGTGSQTCSSDGYSAGSCTIVSCNSGFTANFAKTACGTEVTSGRRLFMTPFSNITAASKDSAIHVVGTYYNKLGSAGQNSNLISNGRANFGVTGSTVKDYSPGDNVSCIIKTDNLAYCWLGNFGFGELGSATAYSETPVAVNTSGVLSGKSVKKISVGAYHVCVIAGNSADALADYAYCWGLNDRGQLGNNSTTNSNQAVLVNRTGVLSGKTILDIKSGNNHTCVLASDSKIYCWGDNTNGKLGVSTTITHNLVPISPDLSASSSLNGKNLIGLGVSEDRTCAITTSEVICWGYNYGFMPSTWYTGSTMQKVVVSSFGALCYLRTNGALTCDGNGFSNVTMSGVKDVAAGSGHFCAVRSSDNYLYCTGSNLMYQLGAGTLYGSGNYSQFVPANYFNL